jgi:hypothetical protein
LYAELLRGLVPQLASALRQWHVSGAFWVRYAEDSRAAGMAAATVRRRELVETNYGVASPCQLDCGKAPHGSHTNDGDVVVLVPAHGRYHTCRPVYPSRRKKRRSPLPSRPLLPPERMDKKVREESPFSFWLSCSRANTVIVMAESETLQRFFHQRWTVN